MSEPARDVMSGQGSSIASHARRNAVVLAAAQAVVGAAAPMAISMGGLAGFYLLGSDKSLATAPVTGFTVGLALGALGAAAVMRVVGRRLGFIIGAAFTAAGGGLAVLALWAGSFWFFAFALAVIGCGGAFVQQYRFAAADNAPPQLKAQAISWVLAGGVFAAVIGPQTVIFSREMFPTVPFAGVFVAMIALGLLGAIILSMLREREDAVVDPASQTADDRPRPLRDIVTQRSFVTAMVCGVGTYALMTFMMTGAPLAMVACGFSPDIATLGIQWHVMAMFAPSFFTGHLIRRFGEATIVGIGLALLLVCACIAFIGIELWNFWLALVLLGIGWNFGFIGSTAMVTATYRQSEKNKVQGFHDGVLFSLVAVASLASGGALNHWGWEGISLVLVPVASLCLLVLGLQVVSDRRKLASA
ncbi:MFS transporter [Rhizobium sp. EC-SD404]|uniref:MFS transporter n=1 Tax=Rhizobium sp. EC-SD404 TaxID=2038389 RepID=UPI0012549E3D|nr:MFS transporter [Rhizobium sp. EC-SD404]VVT16468.1 Riboflavin transporter RfnT [Rhizobium sp. EC-SD404]